MSMCPYGMVRTGSTVDEHETAHQGNPLGDDRAEALEDLRWAGERQVGVRGLANGKTLDCSKVGKRRQGITKGENSFACAAGYLGSAE